MKFKVPFQIYLILMVMLAGILACNFPGMGKSEPTPPVPVSSEAVTQLEENLQSAAATAASGGAVQLVITEGQLTSLATLELSAIQEPRIENIQIRLRDGLVKVTGTVYLESIPLDLKLDLQVLVGADGLPHTQSVSASLGPLPIPDSLLTQFTDQVDEILRIQLSSYGDKVVVQNIVIGDGVMTITGYVE